MTYNLSVKFFKFTLNIKIYKKFRKKNFILKFLYSTKLKLKSKISRSKSKKVQHQLCSKRSQKNDIFFDCRLI